MAFFIVRQPNGKLAAFSEVVDNFTAYDMSIEEAEAYCRDERGMDPQDAAQKVRQGVSDVSRHNMLLPADTPSGEMNKWLGRWHECLGIILRVHGWTMCREWMAEPRG